MSPPSPSDVLAFLEGRWLIEREIDDGDRRGGFRGLATFTRDRDGLVWDEVGELELGTYVGPARRRLRVDRAADVWEVSFDDGRPFHALDLSSGHWEASHDCHADRYDGTFDVTAPDALDIAWRVRGPAKDQRIVSRYRRA